MRVHFIAVGGSAMHNMALALHDKGFSVSGSDDEIFEPSKSRLKAKGLLPKAFGWFEENIHSQLDAVILGMHAKKDNPELLRAQELGIPVYSYPEYVYEQSKEKKRVVIGGSHGKTSITSMILHVLKQENIPFDYLVGAQLDGFDNMVQLSDAPLIILEGDEYLSSPIDRRPKFLWYKPQVAVISGIAWDHINVFPSFELYLKQFEDFIYSMDQEGALIYFEQDENLKKMVEKSSFPKEKIAYQAHENRIADGQTFLIHEGREIPVEVFGAHNLQNLNAALEVCLQLGIDRSQFYQAIQSFSGAAKRLELIAKGPNSLAYKDFAHSPSKLKATTAAVKEQYPKKQLVACMELHTFSSLNKTFLAEYSGSMSQADQALVYYNPHTLKHKGLDEISLEEVKKAFEPSQVKVYNDSELLAKDLKSKNWDNSVLLLMTSGNFDGIQLNEFAEEIIGG